MRSRRSAPVGGGSDQNASDSLEEAAQLQKQADAHIDARQFREATDKTQRALELRRKHLGDTHPDVAYSLNRLGILAYYQGDYTRAETLVQDALRIREATLGANHLAVAESLSDLASMLLVRGDYVRPEPLYQRALAIYEKAPAAKRATTILSFSSPVCSIIWRSCITGGLTMNVPSRNTCRRSRSRNAPGDRMIRPSLTPPPTWVRCITHQPSTTRRCRC